MKIASLSIKNNVFLAPMAGISDLPYRMLMKSFGAGLVFSEMVSANGLIRAGKRTRELLCSDAQERPLAIQLFGDDPEVLAKAAKEVKEDGELLDLNMGCPVNKVIRSGAGSALMRDPQKVGRIVSAVRKATKLPLTVKIRSGWDLHSVNFLEVARIAAQEGADAVTLHPRTRSQGFGGEANWEHIAELKESIAVPVIGSGDIFLPEDALRMLKETGCDAVMIGRGGYGNPWLIRNILALQEGRQSLLPTPEERYRVAQQHMDLYVNRFGERKALFDMRKHLCWYSRGLSEAAGFRTRVNQTQSLQELRDALNEFFSNAQQAPGSQQ